MSGSPTRADRKKISGRDLFYWLPGHMVKVNKDIGRLMDHISGSPPDQQID